MSQKFSMTNEELCVLYHKSSEHDQREIMEMIIKKNVKLIHGILHKLKMTNDDCFQWACLGMMKAVKKFQPEKGFKLSTYAYNWIRESVARNTLTDRTIRIPVYKIPEMSELPRAVTNVNYNCSEKKEFDLYNFVSNKHKTEIHDKAEILSFLKTINFTENELKVLQYRFFTDAYSIREVGEIMGVSHQRVEQLQKEVNKKIKKQAIKEGLRK